MRLNILSDTLCLRGSSSLRSLFKTPKQELHGNTDEHPVKGEVDGHAVLREKRGLTFHQVRDGA